MLPALQPVGANSSLGWRWAIVTARVVALVIWLGLVLILHLPLSLIGRRTAVPPLFLAGMGFLAGLRVTVRGRPASGRLLLIANHISWLDILALAGNARAAFVAHAGLSHQPLLRWFCLQNDTVFITREERGLVAAQIDAIGAALDHRRMVVFPEGTTGDGLALRPFKSALLAAVAACENSVKTQVTANTADYRCATKVQPVVLAYADAHAIAWAGNEPGIRNVARILARFRPIKLTIRYLKPLPEAVCGDRKAMAKVAQDAIAAALHD